jgi:hypothetical protein
MRVAFVPSAPLLLPQLGGGPMDLRSAVQQAISVLRGPVTVLGGATPAGPRTGSVDATPWGHRGPASPDPLPLPLAVGAALLGSQAGTLLAVDGSAVEVAGDLLVVGDGTAKRTEKAPGHFDPRAEAVDAEIASALGAGRAPDLDAELARELLVSGRDVWRTVQRSVTGTFEAEVLYADAPHGVGYVVATWLGS